MSRVDPMSDKDIGFDVNLGVVEKCGVADWQRKLNFSQVPPEPILVGQLMIQDLTVPWEELEWSAKI